jgi:hypothetical protein
MKTLVEQEPAQLTSVRKRTVGPIVLRGSARLRRLTTAIATRRAVIQERAVLRGSQVKSNASTRLLDSAVERQTEGDLEGGWAFLHAAEREEIVNFSDEEFRALVDWLRNEASQKLRGWRRSTASELLGRPGTLPPRANAQDAMRLIHEHSDNQYHKLDLLAEQLGVMTPILLLMLAAFAVIVAIGGVSIGQLGWRDWVALMITGSIGGALSAVRSLGGKQDDKIPDRLFAWPITLLRPALGAAAATGLVLIIQSGVVEFGDGERLALFAAAFLAGFSERWFLGVIRSAGGEDKDKSKA